MGGYVTVEYNGHAQSADHLRGGFNLRERVFATGKRVEVSPEEAGLLIASAPANTVKVHAGEPTTPERRSHRAEDQILRNQRLRAMFPKDPARLLQDTTPLPKAVREGLTGRGAAEFVDKGGADACLLDAAQWARLGGLDEVATACVRRAAALSTVKG